MYSVFKYIVSVLTVILLLSLCLSGCESNSLSHPFSYTQKAFSITVKGQIYADEALLPSLSEASLGKHRSSMSFSAHVSVKPVSPGEVYDHPSSSIWQVQVTYTAPEALSGLTVSCLYHLSAADEMTDVTLTYQNAAGNLTIKRPYTSAAFLCLPATAFLPCSDPISVSPTDGGLTTITVTKNSSQRLYTFAEGHTLPLQIEAIFDHTRVFLQVS